MGAKSKSGDSTEMWWAVLTAILKSMRDRPLAWLAVVWLSGWTLFGWHAIHPASWDTVWGAVNSFLARAQSGGKQPPDPQVGVTWLYEVQRWGQIALFVSTGMLALYTGYALWIWWRYMNVWLPGVRRERLRKGCVLEVLVPAESKTDARAAADMFGHLQSLLSELAGGGSGHRKMGPERLALSLELWSAPHTKGKVGFYIWCPAVSDPTGSKGSVDFDKESDQFIEEIRRLVNVHHPRCRVRRVADPVKQALIDVALAKGISGITLTSWYELGLLADSRYPIGSGGSDERLATGGAGSRSFNRPGSPGTGADSLAAVITMLVGNKDIPVMGIQVVIAARSEGSDQAQKSVEKERARLLDLETKAGKSALGPQHRARLLALEEKADRGGFDAVIRLVAMERIESSSFPTGADARLVALFRKYRQYDRTVAGVKQGFQIVRKNSALLPIMRPISSSASSSPSSSAEPPASSGSPADGVPMGSLWNVGPVLGRWPREGICLPRLLPFMRSGKPCILNTAELSAVYHFPHQGLADLAALRLATYRQIPAPLEAHVTAGQVAEGRHVVLGVVDDDTSPADTGSAALAGRSAARDGARPNAVAIHIPQAVGGAKILPPGLLGAGTRFEDLRRGTYVLGPMGSGKSVFLYNMIVQHMAAGRGVGILDGKGDSYEEVLRLVPPHLEGEVLTFDPENLRAGGGTGGRSIGMNPLDGRVAAQLGVERVESLTMSLMKKMMGANWEQAVLMQRFLRDGITAVLDTEPAPTMLNLWRWLQDDGKGGNEYRDALVGKIRNKLVQDFWQRQVPAMSSQQRSSMQNVLTRVDRYVKNDVRYLLLQPYSTVDFQEILNRGTIFVGRVSPRLGEDQSFLGALVLNGFLAGAFARQSISQEQRRDYLLVVDEFQNFVDTARADVEQMLSMARGYRLGLMLAHQYTDQLPREVLNAILKNVQTWVVFGLQADDARRFAAYMDVLAAEDFQNLPPFYTYQRTIVNNTQTGVYSAAPLPFPAPAENPGAHPAGKPESEHQEIDREVLRIAHVPDHMLELARGGPEESADERQARILKLAKELYRPAEEGDPGAVQILSTLGDADREMYRKMRRNVLDKKERESLLAHPQLIRDKVERIERLSSLRWGTPRAEVEALILATLRGRVGSPDGTGRDTAGAGQAPQIKRYSLMPDLNGTSEQYDEED